MDTTLLMLLLIIVGILVVVLQLVILLTLARKRGATEEDVEGIVDETRHKSRSIIHRAIREANRMLITAELRGIRALARGKLTSKELTEQYQKNLANIEEALKAHFVESANKAEASYDTFIKLIEKTMNEQIARNEKLISDKADEMVKASQTQVANMVEDIHQKVKVQVDAEMEAAKNEIAQYKSSRIAVLDERIMDILEELLRIALEKKLSLADQSDLVYKALEEAKRENAFETLAKPSVQPKSNE